jgi:hypothetical protein
MKSVNCSKPGYTIITCSKIQHILYDLIFTTKLNDYLDFNYDYIMGLFEFVIGEWICRRCYNVNPGYQV